MPVNPNNAVITVPASAPRVTLPNGNIVAVVIEVDSTPIGTILSSYIAEAAAGTTTFYAVAGDSNGFTNGGNPILAMADLLVASGAFTAEQMGADQETFVKNWLSSQTYASAFAAIAKGFRTVIDRIIQMLVASYPAAPPVPTPGDAPTDPVAVFNYGVQQFLTLKANADGTVTGTYTGP